MVAARFAATGMAAAEAEDQGHAVEQWGVFDTAARGPANGNPFVDVTFGARFTLGHRVVEAGGFYDGGGVYRVRFSPDSVGRWSYETTSNAKELAGQAGGLSAWRRQQAIAGRWELRTNSIFNTRMEHRIFLSAPLAIRTGLSGRRSTKRH